MTISNNHNSPPAVGHGCGSGNGSLNNNSLVISLFNWKASPKEEKRQAQVEVQSATGDGEVAILVGGALAFGAAATWAIGKLFGWEGEKKGVVEGRPEGSDPTTMEGVQTYLQ